MNRHCQQCGLEFPTELAAGHCLRCLVRVSLGGDEASGSPPGSRFPQAFGGYDLIEELGRGGMGVVYRARQTALAREVALKMLPGGAFAGRVAMERLRAEAVAAASLRHPNLVPVYDVGECDGQPFFTMELVEGRSLADLVRDGPLSPRQAAKYVECVARAIHFAHEHGLLHRDLKPSNVFIDLFDQPRVMDFGLAKRVGDRVPDGREAGAAGSGAGWELTATGQVLGSPAYMAPEQAAGDRGRVTERSDVYSLGALLYHLVTGRPPFAADTPAGTIQQVLHAEPAPFAILNPGLPRDLETVCLKCLEKDPARRYAAAREMADDLGRFLRGDPIQARPVPGWERAARWCRRNPALATAAALVVSFLIVLTTGAAVAAWRIEGARRSERDQRERADQANAELRTANASLSATVAALELQQAEHSLEAGDTSLGLAGIARVLRRDPGNEVAAERLISALLHRDVLLPAGPGLRHPAAVYGIAWHPGGQLLASACEDGIGRIWKPVDATLVTSVEHGKRLWCAAFDAAGRTLVTAGDDGFARFWDAKTGVAAFAPLLHGSPIRAVAWHPAGQHFATTGEDGRVKLWALPGGTVRADWHAHAERVQAAAFSPDGERLFTASADGTVRAWQGRDGAPLGLASHHSGWAMALSFSPGGRRLAVASRDKSVHLLEAESLARIGAPQAFADGLNAVAISPDGRLLAGGGVDYTARVRDARTGQPRSQSLRHRDQVESVAFSPDGRVLATAGQDGEVQFWDVRTARSLGEPMHHAGAVRWIDLDPAGRRLVSASWDNTARVWNGLMGRPLTPPLRHLSHVHTAVFDPGAERVVTASADATARIWDARTGEPIGRPLSHRVGLWSASFSPDGRRIVTASADGTARLWDAATQQPLGEPMRHERDVFQARFSPDGAIVATASLDDTAWLWEAGTGRPLAGPLRHSDAVVWVEFSPDGRRVATASRDNTARVWDATTGGAVSPPLVHARTVEVIRFSPDGRTVLTTSMDHTARLWDAATGQPVGPPLRHQDQVWHGTFSPDGRRVATGSADGVLRLWDVRTGLPVSEPIRHEGGVKGVQFTPDGDWIAAAAVAPGSSIRVWRVPRAPGAPGAPAEIPRWVADLGEAIAGVRLGADGSIEPVGPEGLRAVQQAVHGDPVPSKLADIAIWLLARRGTRTIAPGHPLEIPAYVEKRLSEDSVGSLDEVLGLDPTNALALGRLARGASAVPGGAPEARALARRALRFDPANAEALEVLGVAGGR